MKVGDAILTKRIEQGYLVFQACDCGDPNCQGAKDPEFVPDLVGVMLLMGQKPEEFDSVKRLLERPRPDECDSIIDEARRSLGINRGHR